MRLKKFRPPSKINLTSLVSVVLSFAVVGTYLLIRSLASTPSIIDYINSPNKTGGQEITVPCGVYTGGRTSVTHPDWLVLKAPTPGCVTVDLSSSGFELHDADFKVVMAGFRFINGVTEVERSSNVIFWYDEFTFPPEEWYRQYTAAGGVLPVNAANCEAMTRLRNNMANGLPSGIRTDNAGDGSTGKFNSHIGLYGTDIHDVGDDGMFFYGMQDFKVQGTKIWNVSSNKNGLNIDNVHDCSPYGGDWFHNDAFQSTGEVSDITVSDSWFGHDIEWESEGGHFSNVTFKNMWLAGSPTTGWIFAKNASGPGFANHVIDHIRSFAEGQQHLGDTWYAAWRTDFSPCPNDSSKSCEAVWINNNGQEPYPYDFRGQPGWDIKISNIDTSAPAGITLSQSGWLVNGVDEIKNHQQNPANLWRAAHPYETYLSTLGISITSSNPPTTPPPTSSPAPTANPNASANAKAVLSYLKGLPSRSTHRTISGEFGDWNPGKLDAVNTVYANTGHYLGMFSTDYQDWGRVNDNFQSINSLLTDYWNAGGLVTISYHSLNPFTGADLRDMTGVDIPATLTPGTTQHQQWLTYLDKTASGLQQLKNNGVVVLWRPFHEMNYPFFWWGGRDPEQFKALWRDMFNYFTNTKGLNNLLWVYGPSAGWNSLDYYPGSAYVDVAGMDIYQPLSPTDWWIDNYEAFRSLGKPIAFTEFGPSGEGNVPYDWTNLLATIKQKYPEVTYVATWGGRYGLDYSLYTGSKAMLDDPWMANREDIAWKSSTPAPPTSPSPPPSDKPNLMLTSLTASPSSPKPGDKVNFSATIKNAGSAATPSGTEIDLSFRINGAEVTWAIDAGPLGPGNSLTLSTNSGTTAGTWTAVQGTPTLEAFVDNLGRIAESNEDDNKKAIGLVISTPNQSPTVSLTVPTSTLIAPATASLSASASDADGTISKVEFYSGSTLLSSDTTAPYSFSWANLAAGSYNITAKATDNSGAVTTSSVRTISVIQPQPDLLITALSMTPSNPKPGDKVRFSATIKNANGATAATPANVIHDTQFYINDVPITWSDNYRPAQNSKPNGLQPGEEVTITANGGPNVEMSTGLWTATAGTFNLSAYVNACPTGCTGGDRITNELSRTNNSLSQQLIIATTPPANKSPVVSLTSPNNNSSLTAPATINLAATASDSDGTITKVEFYQGTTKLGEDTTAPYSYNWANVPTGNYNLTAKATDNKGAISNSVSVVVKVVAKPAQQPPVVTTPPPQSSPQPPQANTPAPFRTPRKIGDVDGNDRIDIRDLSILLSHWHKNANSTQGDLNNDNKVDILDLSIVLSKWGK